MTAEEMVIGDTIVEDGVVTAEEMVIGDDILPDGPGLGFDNTQLSPTLTYYSE